MRVQFFRIGVMSASLAAIVACSNDHPPTPARSAESAAPRPAYVEAPSTIERTTPYRAKLGHGAELYLPPWFSPKKSGYDLIVHFHGLSKLQEANVEHLRLNVAVVSVNLGAGSDPYANMFKDPNAWPRLLAEAQEEIDKSGRAPNATVHRIALSAWSAGALSVQKVLLEPANVERVDAVLLADGLFTSYSDPRRKIMNTTPLEKLTHLVDVAEHDQKLFAITHTMIPTYDYPSMMEVVGKLLELVNAEKIPSSKVDPHEMHEAYVFDKGSFHVKGFEGVLAGDHIKQIKAMGETLYPYLKERWDAQDAAATDVRTTSRR